MRFLTTLVTVAVLAVCVCPVAQGQGTSNTTGDVIIYPKTEKGAHGRANPEQLFKVDRQTRVINAHRLVGDDMVKDPLNVTRVRGYVASEKKDIFSRDRVNVLLTAGRYWNDMTSTRTLERLLATLSSPDPKPSAVKLLMQFNFFFVPQLSPKSRAAVAKLEPGVCSRDLSKAVNATISADQLPGRLGSILTTLFRKTESYIVIEVGTFSRNHRPSLPSATSAAALSAPQSSTDWEKQWMIMASEHLKPNDDGFPYFSVVEKKPQGKEVAHIHRARFGLGLTSYCLPKAEEVQERSAKLEKQLFGTLQGLQDASTVSNKFLKIHKLNRTRSGRPTSGSSDTASVRVSRGDTTSSSGSASSAILESSLPDEGIAQAATAPGGKDVDTTGKVEVVDEQPAGVEHAQQESNSPSDASRTEPGSVFSGAASGTEEASETANLSSSNKLNGENGVELAGSAKNTGPTEPVATIPSSASSTEAQGSSSSTEGGSSSSPEEGSSSSTEEGSSSSTDEGSSSSPEEQSSSSTEDGSSSSTAEGSSSSPEEGSSSSPEEGSPSSTEDGSSSSTDEGSSSSPEDGSSSSTDEGSSSSTEDGSSSSTEDGSSSSPEEGSSSSLDEGSSSSPEEGSSSSPEEGSSSSTEDGSSSSTEEQSSSSTEAQGSSSSPEDGSSLLSSMENGSLSSGEGPSSSDTELEGSSEKRAAGEHGEHGTSSGSSSDRDDAEEPEPPVGRVTSRPLRPLRPRVTPETKPSSDTEQPASNTPVPFEDPRRGTFQTPSNTPVSTPAHGKVEESSSTAPPVDTPDQGSEPASSQEGDVSQRARQGVETGSAPVTPVEDTSTTVTPIPTQDEALSQLSKKVRVVTPQVETSPWSSYGALILLSCAGIFIAYKRYRANGDDGDGHGDARVPLGQMGQNPGAPRQRDSVQDNWDVEETEWGEVSDGWGAGAATAGQRHHAAHDQDGWGGADESGNDWESF